MNKKFYVIIIAVVAIVLIAIFGVGKNVVEKYSYGTDKADLAEYYGVSGDQLAIILQNDKLGYTALYKNDACYFSMDMINECIGTGFYFADDYNDGTLMFTVGDGTYETGLGSTSYTYKGQMYDMPYQIAFMSNGSLYIAADYISRFFTFNYEVFDYKVQVKTEWGDINTMTVQSNTQIRVQGGTKSDILREVAKGEIVELIESMETWSKVKTSDSFIGYIENKRMKDAGVVKELVPEEVNAIVIDELTGNERVCMGFHSVAGVGGNDTLYGMLEEGKGINVIAPTWFSMIDDIGSIRNFSSSSYVNTAHASGVKVWGVLDNFNYENETGNAVSDLNVLANTVNRRNLEKNIVDAAIACGMDGINLDFEGLSADCGNHYAQFIKELSVLTHENGLVLSVDNYVPFHYNEFYHIDVQGIFADYVLIMGYDEHYHGSGEPGSVASFDYVANGLDKTLEMARPEKIINALPFYTIVWKNNGGTVTDSYLTTVNQDEFISKYGITYNWDEKTCQNYAEWVSSDGSTYMVWFEDLDSITAKLNAMNARNIGGVAVWRLGYGTKEVWNLVALYKEMTQAAG